MIPNTWSKELYYSNFCFERHPAKQPLSFHLGPPVDGPDIYFNGSEADSYVMNYPLRSLGCEAKRARVENIIQGMSGSPDVSDANLHEVIQGTSKNICLHENQLRMFEMHQLQNQYQFCQSGEVKKEDGNSKSLEKTLRSPSMGQSQKHSNNFFLNEYHKVKPIKYSQFKAEKVKLMKDVLKCELSKALSTSVDTIFKTTKEETSEPSLHHLHSGIHSFSEISALPGPATQTEALSLVVRNDKPHTVSQSKKSSSHGLIYHKKPKGFEKRQLEMSDRSMSLKLRSKVNSRAESMYTIGHAMLKSLPLSRVKQCPGESSTAHMFSISEGLTTEHLKKAKLMFFYTRYPSSFVLKMCFSDVKFTRCITSQLIKWFSNFREFFYIQMEKFARHAVLGGVSGDAALTVGRESELFRVLNLHYNKTSDFQVPDSFLEVAEITLREFYISICLGRDQDPSWKKAIYRVISKLDSEVPAHFILT